MLSESDSTSNNMEDTTSGDDKNVDSDTVPKKKAKWLCSFQASWEADYERCGKVASNKFKAHCTLCNRKFTVGHGGLNDIMHHFKSSIPNNHFSHSIINNMFILCEDCSHSRVEKQLSNSHLLNSSTST